MLKKAVKIKLNTTEQKGFSAGRAYRPGAKGGVGGKAVTSNVRIVIWVTIAHR